MLIAFCFIFLTPFLPNIRLLLLWAAPSLGCSSSGLLLLWAAPPLGCSSFGLLLHWAAPHLGCSSSGLLLRSVFI